MEVVGVVIGSFDTTGSVGSMLSMSLLFPYAIVTSIVSVFSGESTGLLLFLSILLGP